ncbi:MAG: hypothetical protein EXR75_06280 [Myxococcales bacterium]|nr:hypothetical protein [Myxococcales bacterium]
MVNHTHQLVLRTLLDMGRANELLELRSLAKRIGTSCTCTLDVLGVLEGAGLVDADRVRLTMAGLAVAASSSHRAGARRRVSARSRRHAA